MKKLILILILLSTLPLFGQVRLSTMDSITTFGIYDYSYWNALSGDAYLNRKVSWTALRAAMIDYIDGLANTWALKQTFSSGATFSAGANGAVTFNDSVVCIAGAPLWVHWIQRVSPSSTIGSAAAPFFTIYANNFTVPNTEGNDSVSITYDDSTLTIDKAISFSGLTITESVGMDSGATFTGMILGNVEYTVSTAADSIITLTTYAPSVELILPADVTSPGISRLHVNEATKGQVIRLWNPGGAYVIAFTQSVADDDNLTMAGDDTLAYADNLTFQYIGLSGGKQIWMEVSRTDNVQ